MNVSPKFAFPSFTRWRLLDPINGLAAVSAVMKDCYPAFAYH